jgi:fermentation-respiration switch protein FrsA (DUF1100 family)
MSTTTEVRTVTVGGQRLRVAIRPGPNEPGRPPRFPLLLINGIGARLELLEPFVAALDPAGPSRGYLYQLAATAGWTSLPFLPWLRQPTLILAGDDDPIIPLANARLMHRLIRDSRLHVYHDGHLGLVTEAAELAPLVDVFLAAP